MRIPRGYLRDEKRSQVFHVISRVVDRRLIFENPEKHMMLRMLRQLEAFSGVEVLSYCLMGNHFHLLVNIPRRPERISDEEVWRRMKYIYNPTKLSEIEERMRQQKELGNLGYESMIYDSMRARMYDLSQFVKDFKLRFSKWYNWENRRVGTLWEERFRSVLVEGSEGAMMRIASYIELNPVRAGIASTPENYFWNSISEAIRGEPAAQRGMIHLASGIGHRLEWEKAFETYRKRLEKRYGQVSSRQNSGQVLTEKDVDCENRSKLSGMARSSRVGTLTDGVVIGSREFIEELYGMKLKKLSPHKARLAHPLKEEFENQLYSYRKKE